MKKSCFVIGFVLLAAGVAAGYFIGRQTAPQDLGTTFYAVVEAVDGSHFQVSGLEINDWNSRGRYTFTAGADTRLEWHGSDLEPEDFEPGDLVSVTWTGYVQESDPARLERILLIQLLDDEL